MCEPMSAGEVLQYWMGTVSDKPWSAHDSRGAHPVTEEPRHGAGPADLQWTAQHIDWLRHAEWVIPVQLALMSRSG